MFTLENSDALAAVFSQRAKRHEDSFVNSLAYYILTGRHSTKVYTNGENHIVTCEHPHRPGTTLIFPEIGNGPSISSDVLIYLHAEQGDFQFARYTAEDMDKTKASLSLKANRQIAEIEPTQDFDMDWVYPVRMLSTSKVALMQGKEFDTVRNKFNKVRSKVEVHRLEPSINLKDMRACVHFWMGSIIAAGTQDAENRMGFYGHLINTIDRHPNLFDGFVVYGKDEPVGFTIWDKNLNDTANSLASLSRRSLKGLSEFQIVTACRILHTNNISYLNLGGSENASLDEHKLKFKPVKSIDIRSYNINFLESRPIDLQTIRLI